MTLQGEKKVTEISPKSVCHTHAKLHTLLPTKDISIMAAMYRNANEEAVAHLSLYIEHNQECTF